MNIEAIRLSSPPPITLPLEPVGAAAAAVVGGAVEDRGGMTTAPPLLGRGGILGAVVVEAVVSVRSRGGPRLCWSVSELDAPIRLPMLISSEGKVCRDGMVCKGIE